MKLQSVAASAKERVTAAQFETSKYFAEATAIFTTLGISIKSCVVAQTRRPSTRRVFAYVEDEC